MKKKVLAAVLAATALTTSAAFAQPVELSGSVNVHYRWNDDPDGVERDGGKLYFYLNARGELVEDVDFFARLAAQKLTGDRIGADFETGKYGNEVITLDRFGLEFQGKGFTYAVGRQGATIGATGLLYSTESYMGSDMGALDGIKITGKSGVTDLKFIAGRQWNTEKEDDKVYALQASYSPAENWTLGATIAKYEDENNKNKDTNNWAVNVGYTVGKAGLFAEYGKSDADAEDTAYVFGVDYTFDAKNSAYVLYSKVEKNADMGGMTDFDNNGKGIYIGYAYQIDKDTTLSLFYKDMEEVDGGNDYNSFRTTVTYKF